MSRKGSSSDGPSRRAVLGAATAVAASPEAALAKPADHALQLSSQWLRLHAEIEDAYDRWRKLENWLVADHNWFGLTEIEQLALPAAEPMRNLDLLITRLNIEEDAVAMRLTGRKATTLVAIISRFTVVQEMIQREDNPEAHAILRGSVQDLILWAKRNPDQGIGALGHG